MEKLAAERKWSEVSLRDIAGGHQSACHYAEQVTAETVAKAAEARAREHELAVVELGSGAEV